MKPKNPCYKCAERTADCHAKCEIYAEFSKAQEKHNTEIRYQKNKDWAMNAENRQELPQK